MWKRGAAGFTFASAMPYAFETGKKKIPREPGKERGGSAQYYDKETHADAMRRHRRHKKKLSDKGELE